MNTQKGDIPETDQELERIISKRNRRARATNPKSERQSKLVKPVIDIRPESEKPAIENPVLSKEDARAVQDALAGLNTSEESEVAEVSKPKPPIITIIRRDKDGQEVRVPIADPGPSKKLVLTVKPKVTDSKKKSTTAKPKATPVAKEKKAPKVPEKPSSQAKTLQEFIELKNRDFEKQTKIAMETSRGTEYWRRVGWTLMPETDNDKMVHCVERLHMVDGKDFCYRFGYYIISKNGTWTRPMNAPMYYNNDYVLLYEKAKEEGTILEFVS